jgi:hypothetical protein
MTKQNRRIMLKWRRFLQAERHRARAELPSLVYLRRTAFLHVRRRLSDLTVEYPSPGVRFVDVFAGWPDLT